MKVSYFVKNNATLLVVIIITLVGLVLYATGIQEVIKLTPLYILSVMAIQWYEQRGQKDLLKSWVIAGGIGFCAELIGVKTGLLFGDYRYGDILGPKLLDVPILVAALWALVMSVLWSVTHTLSPIKRVVICMVLAVTYDITLEHFAVRFGLWYWAGSIPLSNALGWAFTSGLIATVYMYRTVSLLPTKSVRASLLIQSIFFIALLLLY